MVISFSAHVPPALPITPRYVLKQQPEDFVVKEIPLQHLQPLYQPARSGKYLYFRLKKKNWNTLDAVKEIARQLKIKEKQIGFAGSKDKKALTEQMCSLRGARREQLLSLRIKDVKIEFLGYGDQPLSLGDLQGNYFEIVVRNLDGSIKAEAIRSFPNYFDEQRFGENNIPLGRLLLKKEFEKVIELLRLPPLQEHLHQHPGDYIGALRQLPLRQLRLYLNAYQSWLWNETMAELLRRKGRGAVEIPYRQGNWVLIENEEDFRGVSIPLIGFGLDLPGGIDNFRGIDDNSGAHETEIQEIISSLLAREGISPMDFIMKQIPPLTLEGERRKAVAEVKDLKVGKVENDDLFEGKYKMKLTFSLPKGSYATMAVRKILWSYSTLRLNPEFCAISERE